MPRAFTFEHPIADRGKAQRALCDLFDAIAEDKLSADLPPNTKRPVTLEVNLQQFGTLEVTVGATDTVEVAYDPSKGSTKREEVRLHIGKPL